MTNKKYPELLLKSGPDKLIVSKPEGVIFIELVDPYSSNWITLSKPQAKKLSKFLARISK